MEDLDRLFGGGLGFIAEGEEADQPLLWRCRGYPGDGASVALQFFGVSRERPPFDPFFLHEARASEDEPVIFDFSGDASTGQSLHRSRLRRRDCLFRRSEEHTSELQSLMRTSYAFFFLKK